MNAAVDLEWDLLQADARACRSLFPVPPSRAEVVVDLAGVARWAPEDRPGFADLIGEDWSDRVRECSGLGC